MDFTVLMDELVTEPELKAEMETLLERKKEAKSLISKREFMSFTNSLKRKLKESWKQQNR